ncbi:MAG: hypothetical protein MHM6MM_007635, partial [Cercozoa sp. M6MM]
QGSLGDSGVRPVRRGEGSEEEGGNRRQDGAAPCAAGGSVDVPRCDGVHQLGRVLRTGCRGSASQLCRALHCRGGQQGRLPVRRKRAQGQHCARSVRGRVVPCHGAASQSQQAVGRVGLPRLLPGLRQLERTQVRSVAADAGAAAADSGSGASLRSRRSARSGRATRLHGAGALHAGGLHSGQASAGHGEVRRYRRHLPCAGGGLAGGRRQGRRVHRGGAPRLCLSGQRASRVGTPGLARCTHRGGATGRAGLRRRLVQRRLARRVRRLGPSVRPSSRITRRGPATLSLRQRSSPPPQKFVESCMKPTQLSTAPKNS